MYLPGAVRKGDSHAHVSTGRDEAAGDNAFHQHRIDVSARQDHNGLSDRVNLFGKDRSDANSTSRFDNEFRAFQKHHQCAGDVIVTDGDNLVDRVLNDGEIERPWTCDRNSIRDGRLHFDGCRFTGSK